MKLIYLSAKIYPASTADHIFVLEMAKAFTKILNTDFSLVVANDFSEELLGVNIVNLKFKIRKGMTLFFYFWIPYFIFTRKLNNKEVVFFSVDQNLLRVVIFYKRILKLKYKIISDWHMLFEAQKDAYVVRYSDGLITTTNQLKNLLLSRFSVSGEKIRVFYGGVSLENFNETGDSTRRLREHLKLPANSFLVGYVGFYKTIGMSKGLDTMIRALALIKDDSVKMVFVGGRSEEIEEYKKIAENEGVTHRVVFVPKVPTSEVPFFEQAMDVLVIPYPNEPHFRDYGFPMKTYEYMATKRPIIYSNLPIIAEVLHDCAISFIAGDSKDLAEKILSVKSNQTKNEELTNKAYNKVLDCTWDKRAEKIVTFLRGL